jgi:homoaconitase
MNFLASPEIVTAMCLSGKTTFNPATDYLEDKDGRQFQLSPPRSDDLPKRGFDKGRYEYGFPVFSDPDPNIEINISPNSDRLQLLSPFQPWDGQEFTNMRIAVKARGKCTTDHISAAGPWLKVCFF